VPRRPVIPDVHRLANEALSRALLANSGGGGGGGGGGAAQALVYVNQQGGVDAPGNGTFEHPYATLTFAMSQITDNSASKPYTIWTAGGTYAAPSLKPWTYVTGIDPLNTPTLTGDMAIDASFVGGDEAGATNLVFNDPQSFNLSAAAASVLDFYDCVFGSDFSFTGSAGTTLLTYLSGYFGTSTVTPAGATWTSFNDTFALGETLTIAGTSTSSTVTMNGSAVEASLTIEGSGTAYQYTHNSALPAAGITFSSGATPTALQQLNNNADWDIVTSGAAIAVNQTLKATGTGYVPLATTDDAGACVGVSLDAASGSGIAVRSQNIGQMVTVINDGTAAISIGDRIIPSSTIAGDVTHSAVSGTNTIGVAKTAAAATPGATFTMIFQPGQV
jgi:hypothetical protein